MDWRDEGILLNVREHGESAAIIDVLTSAHGRHAGLVRGGQGRTMSAALQPGAQLTLEWRARLEDHLGNYRIEPIRSRAAILMEDRAALAAFNAMAALVTTFVPEREPDFELYEATLDLVDDLCERPRDWPGTYVRWEGTFLAALGFGLDLSRCAATGTRHDLAFVSPRTGRAVSRDAGGPYADRLLPIASFMVGEGVVTISGVRASMRTLGWFLENRVSPAVEREGPLPEARARLMQLFERMDLPPRPQSPAGAPVVPEPNHREEAWHRRLGVSRGVV
ncbi:MAG: DNA repair protein RecO [Pseudomonadota bacterium]